VTRALQKIAQTHPAWLPASRLIFRYALEPQAIRNFVNKHEEIQRVLLFLCGGLDAEGKADPLAVYRQPALARWLEGALRRRLPLQQWVDELKGIWLDAGRTPEESAESLLALLGLGEDVWPLLQDPAARPTAVARARELLGRTLATQGEAADIHVVEAILPEAIKVAAGFPELVEQALAAARQIQDELNRARALANLAPCLLPELLPEALVTARQIQNERYRAYALRNLIPELGKHIVLWKAFWLQLRRDLLRSRPYRIAEAVVQRLSPPLPWEWIASPATRPTALEEILRSAYPEGKLSLTAEAAQAIQTLLEAGEETNALALLRLARPQKDVPIPEQWLTHPSPEIRHLAYLLRAEAGALDTTTLESLVALLRGVDDRCRYRASQVLLQTRPTSHLTPSFIEALARLAQETENEPQVGTVLDWALTPLEHDQSEWLSGWLERMESDKVRVALSLPFGI